MFPHKEAQTFAICCTVHHKPQMYMGNLRPFGCSSKNICSLVVFTVVIVQLSSFMSLRSFRIAGAKLHNFLGIQIDFAKKLLCGQQISVVWAS